MAAAKCAAFLLQFTSNLDEPPAGPKYARMLVRPVGCEAELR